MTVFTTWWPGSLPQCRLRGVQRTPLSNTIAFGTEVGPGKTRRRSTARVKRVTMSVKLETVAQVATFESFFEDTLKDGALTFAMNDPTDRSTQTWRFDQQAPYTLSEQGTAYILAMNLDRQP